MSFKRPDPVFLDMLRRAGSTNPAVAAQGQDELAIAIQTPLREGVLSGDIVSGIFEAVPTDGTSAEYPMDLLSPGDEVNHVAYTNPGHGRVPERSVEADYIQIHTYPITNSIDFLSRFARDAKYDVTNRAVKVMEAGFVKKMNNDGWHTVLAAGVDRNILVYDADAAAGQFTKRFLSLMKTVMRRNSGGNSASTGRGRLTDVYLSPEALEEIRNWGVDIVDETTRREIYVSTDDGLITRIFGVDLHALDELGENQEYQQYYTSQLSGVLGPAADTELIVGLDLAAGDSFIMPVREEVVIHPDPSMHRKQRVGFYGFAEMGFGALDTRRVLLGSA